MTRTIPPMKHAPHADDCPAVGGTGGIRPKRGKCNCGRFYPRRQRVIPVPGEIPCENCEGTGWENMGPVPGNLLLDVYRYCRVCEGWGTLAALGRAS